MTKGKQCPYNTLCQTRNKCSECTIYKEYLCVHYWVLNEKNYGRCKHCGAEKQFPTLKEVSQKFNSGRAEVNKLWLNNPKRVADRGIQEKRRYRR